MSNVPFYSGSAEHSFTSFCDRRRSTAHRVTKPGGAKPSSTTVKNIEINGIIVRSLGRNRITVKAFHGIKLL